MPKIYTKDNVKHALTALSKPDIIAASSATAWGRQDRRSRAHLLETVVTLSPLEQVMIQSAVNSKKRKSEVQHGPEHAKQRKTDTESEDRHETTTSKEDSFLQPPSPDVVESCIANFIDRTSNAALARATCAVCASEGWKRCTKDVQVEDLWNKHLLYPLMSHEAHVLTDGMLLQLRGVKETNNRTFVTICAVCERDLKAAKIPKLALSNGMWVGDIPMELAVLTLPEKILIAKCFPAAYIIKLFPKQKGAKRWATTGLNSGIKGNVSTYRLNVDDIASLVDPIIMPPPPQILAATVGVTIIGPQNLPERTMPGFLRVKRSRIRAALRWLKLNNPLYANIIISDEMLEMYSDDNSIPEEILALVKYSDDMEAVDSERAGYVVEDDDIVDEGSAEFSASPGELYPPGVSGVMDIDEDEDGLEDDFALQEEPCVIPLTALGVVDAGGSDISDNQLLALAMAKISECDLKTGQAVKRSSDFVNEYPRRDDEGAETVGDEDNPNIWLASFPTLFPYGEGGIEVSRRRRVTMGAHVKWALQYEDKRFRNHLQFMFQAFGVLQKRQVASSTGLQISRKDFMRHEESIRALKPSDFLNAAKEESRNIPFSNPAIQDLRKHVSAIRAKVMGTDESRIKIRAQIWSTSVMCGPPSLWITINPSDTNDPIAQVIAGCDIDLDNFVNTEGPDRDSRASTIASDPYAASEFFHFIISVILEELMGIKGHTKNHPRVERKEGIFGKVSNYIGTVEAQGRGTLHLHMIVWLEGAPTVERMREMLKGESFRAKVSEFIKVNIKGDVDGMNTRKISDLPRAKGVSYSRPVEPRLANYATEKFETEKRLVRALQVHQCTREACLVLKKNGYRCKRNAPFALSTRDYIDEDGSWGPKRTYGFINNWCPAIMHCVRSNHDIKLVSNGTETKDVAWYITSYVAKKQRESSNVSALFAKRIAYHRKQEKYNSDLTQINKRLMQRCANTLSREQEFSSPEVSGYLAGHGDRMLSGHYTIIYLGAIGSKIRRSFPGLKQKKHNESVSPAVGCCSPEDENDELVVVTIENAGVSFKDQAQEYMDRGDDLQDMNYLDFFLETYDGESLPTIDLDDKKVGPKASQRSPYRPDRNHGTKCRIFRRTGHETLPEFVGPWFPRRDAEGFEDYFAAWMLALLKPWRKIGDISGCESSLLDQFLQFESRTSVRNKKIIQNIQYYHQAMDGAAKRNEKGDERPDIVIDHDEFEEDDVHTNPTRTYTAKDLEAALEPKHTRDELLYTNIGMMIAEEAGFFKDDVRREIRKRSPKLAKRDDAMRFLRLEEAVKAVTKQATVEEPVTTDSIQMVDIDNDRPMEGGIEEPGVLSVATGSPDDFGHKSKLNLEQRRAHDIVASHLDAHLDGKRPPQLLMTVIGPGGTGKSTLLNAITSTFEERHSGHLLFKTAMSGVAATLIGGTTLHSWGAIPAIGTPTGDEWMDRRSTTKEVKARRQRNIANTEWLAIDEVSMLTTDLLTLTSQVAGFVKTGSGRADSTVPFGGINVLLMGDFHQFPPVGNPQGALYSAPNLIKKEATSRIVGRNIYSQFETVITLTEQMRITDDAWMHILQRSRTGDCTKEDLGEIRKLVLTNPKCDIPDLDEAPWDDVILVTPRNIMRERWNGAALRRHCVKSGELLYVCQAEDAIGKDRREPTMEEMTIIAGLDPDDDMRKLHTRIEIAIGMKAMVTVNISTEADLANGTRGTVTDIILDHREELDASEIASGVVTLLYPPEMIVFKPLKSTFPRFEGLKDGEIPLFPSEVGFQISNSANQRIKAHRRQFALTAGYAFTLNKSQGQTLECVIVDIRKPPRPYNLDSFGVYVALSRSRGRKTIRLLGDFDDNLFTAHGSEDLRKEDERLQKNTELTKDSWELGLYR